MKNDKNKSVFRDKTKKLHDFNFPEEDPQELCIIVLCVQKSSLLVLLLLLLL